MRKGKNGRKQWTLTEILKAKWRTILALCALRRGDTEAQRKHAEAARRVT